VSPRARAATRRLRAAAPLLALGLAFTFAVSPGCARSGRLTYVPQPASPVQSKAAPAVGREPPERITLKAMFGDTLIGLAANTGDSTRRYLGRLRDGYAVDTLNVILFGDNRPGWRASRLAREFQDMQRTFSGRPGALLRGVGAVPVMLGKGLFPDLALVRDVPDRIRQMPTWGRERQVVSAVLSKVDSLQKLGQRVACTINTGDLVNDGRYPAHWARFLTITRPLFSRVPYFAVAGNHERTDTELGVQNWRTATGLPVGGDRLYYCFDSADGWVRFIALDTNPIVDPGGRWSRKVQVDYSQEQFTWLVERVKEHTGPVIVMMHHPPFSVGYHRDEWQRDSVLANRRRRMVTALHEQGISVIVSGHEHCYERALLTWPDAVLVNIVSGGGGAPLLHIPSQDSSATWFSQYQVAGSRVERKNVLVAEVFNFTLLRVWFGGGEFYTYAVDAAGKPTQIDHVMMDLSRYGVPKIDQHKIPVPPEKGPHLSSKPVAVKQGQDPMAQESKAATDTVSASRRLLTQPPPGKPKKRTARGR